MSVKEILNIEKYNHQKAHHRHLQKKEFLICFVFLSVLCVKVFHNIVSGFWFWLFRGSGAYWGRFRGLFGKFCDHLGVILVSFRASGGPWALGVLGGP